MTRLTEQEYAEILQRMRRKPKLEQSQFPSISEKDFQQQVKDLARMLGWKTYHTLRSKGSDPGFPDLILVRVPPDDKLGRLIAAELKLDGQKLTPPQASWLNVLQYVIAVQTYVWHPSDWETIQKVLR